MKNDKTVLILGQVYSISFLFENEDKMLKTCDGYTDKTTHRIVVAEKGDDCNLGNYKVYQKKVLRHEIIHAFLFEAGLHGEGDWTAKESEHPEQMVDWIAVMFPKMLKVFQAVNAL